VEGEVDKGSGGCWYAEEGEVLAQRAVDERWMW
jgi:hypothetical protein